MLALSPQLLAVEQSLLPLTAPMLALSPQEVPQLLAEEQSLLPLTAPMLALPVAGQAGLSLQLPQHSAFAAPPLTAPGLAVVSFEVVLQAPRAATRVAAAKRRIMLITGSWGSNGSEFDPSVLGSRPRRDLDWILSGRSGEERRVGFGGFRGSDPTGEAIAADRQE